MKNHPIKEEAMIMLHVLNTEEMTDKKANKAVLSRHLIENMFVVEAPVQKINRDLLGQGISHTQIKNSTEDMASVEEDSFNGETSEFKKAGTVTSGKVVLNTTIEIQIQTAPDPGHHEDRMEGTMNV